MEIKVDQVLTDFDDNPLSHPDTREPWTVGLILFTVALGAPEQGKTYSEAESSARYWTAMDINLAFKNGKDKTIDLSIEMAAKLKADIVRSFGPIVAGQMSMLLNGSTGRPN